MLLRQLLLFYLPAYSSLLHRFDPKLIEPDLFDERTGNELELS